MVISLRTRAPGSAGHGEHHSLLLFSVLGMAVLVSAQNLITLFIGFELLSIPLYVLCASEYREGSTSSAPEMIEAWCLKRAISATIEIASVRIVSTGTTRSRATEPRSRPTISTTSAPQGDERGEGRPVDVGTLEVMADREQRDLSGEVHGA